MSLYRIRPHGFRNIVLALSILSAGCAAAGDEQETGSPTGDPDTVTVEFNQYPGGYDSIVSEVFSQEEIFGMLVDIAVQDSYLVASDHGGEPFIHLVGLADGKVLRSVGRKGDGPEEFRAAPTAISGPESSHRVWFPDIEGHRLVGANLAQRPPSQPGQFLDRTARLEMGIHALTAWNTGFIAGFVDSVGQRSLVQLDSLGQRLTTIAPIDIVDDRAPASMLLGAYDYHLCASPDGQWAALGYAGGGMVQILSLAAGTLHPAEVPFAYRPHLTAFPGTNRFVYLGGRKSKTRLGYGKCGATDQYVLSLFRGRLSSALQFEGKPRRYKSFIHVFDWSGRLVRVLRLDHFATTIALDPAGEWLYSVAEDQDGPRVIRRTRVGPLLASLQH